jgi:hypothetical protein
MINDFVEICHISKKRKIMKEKSGQLDNSNINVCFINHLLIKYDRK